MTDIYVGNISCRYPNYVTYDIIIFQICHIRHNSLLIMSYTTFSALYYAIYDTISFLKYVTYDIIGFLRYVTYNIIRTNLSLLAGIFGLILSQDIYFNQIILNINLYEYPLSVKVDLNFYQEKSHFPIKTAHFCIRYHYFIN